MRRTWRDWVRPIIAGVIAKVGTVDAVALRRALRNARPQMIRSTSWGKKIWCDEVNTQLGIKAERKAEKKRAAEQAAGQTLINFE